jgi:hypothetical protein
MMRALELRDFGQAAYKTNNAYPIVALKLIDFHPASERIAAKPAIEEPARRDLHFRNAYHSRGTRPHHRHFYGLGR